MIKASTLELLSELLQKAFLKAEEKNPRYQIMEFGLYKVEGSKGNWYDVRAGRNTDQEFFIACQCRASLESKACYHAAVVFGVHVSEAQKRIDEKNKPENRPYFSGGNSSTKKPEKVGNIRV